MRAFIVLASCFVVAGCSENTPPADFLQLQVNLSYPSGHGSMGYNVARVQKFCMDADGSTSWESSKGDYILNCDRKDPPTKSAANLRWLFRPAKVHDQIIAVLISASADGSLFSRRELEMVASSIPSDPISEKPKEQQVTVPVIE